MGVASPDGECHCNIAW